MRSFHRQLWSLEKASPVHGFGNGRPGSAGGWRYPGRGDGPAGYVSAYAPYPYAYADAADDVVDGAGAAPGYDLPRGDGRPAGYGSAAPAGGAGVPGIANGDGRGDHGYEVSAGYGTPGGPEGREMTHGNGVGVVEGIRDGVVRIDRVVSVDDHGFNGVGGVDASPANGFDHDPAVGGGVAAAAVSPQASASPGLRRRRSLGYHRRRRALAVLLAVVATTLAPALLLGGGWWVAQVVANGLLLGYVALLVRRQRRLRERREKIRYLTAFRPPRPSVVVLHGGAAR